MNQPAPQSPPQSQAMTWPSWRLVLLLMAICFLAHFNRNSMPVAGASRIMEEYKIKPTDMGWVYSAFLITYTLFMIPGGWLIDRRGPRFALQVMCLASAIFVILTGLIGKVTDSALLALPAFLVIRALMGLVSAPLHPAAANALSLGIPPLQRSAANGLVTGAALLGIASSYLVFGGLIDWLGWPGAFVVAGVATIVVGILWSQFAIKDRPANPSAAHNRQSESIESNGGVSGFLRRNKNLLLVTCSYAAVGYFQYLFFYWMQFYFKDELKLNDQDSRFYATIPPLAMALGMPIGGWLSDRVQKRFGWRAARGGIAASALIISATLLLLGVNAKELFWNVTWLSLALGVLGTLEGPFWVTAVEVGKGRGGLSTGIFNTGGNIGGIVAPVLTPWISKDLGLGWEYAMGVGSVVCVMGAVLWFWIDDPRENSVKGESASIFPRTSMPLTTSSPANNVFQQSSFVPNPA